MSLTLSTQQVRELRWFCKNVTGVRGDFYDVRDKVNSFDERIKRLEKTSELIEKFLGPDSEKKQTGVS